MVYKSAGQSLKRSSEGTAMQILLEDDTLILVFKFNRQGMDSITEASFPLWELSLLRNSVCFHHMVEGLTGFWQVLKKSKIQ